MCDSNKKKSKSKSKPVTQKQHTLTTDAVPANDSPSTSNGTQVRNENKPPQSNFESDQKANGEEKAQNFEKYLDPNSIMTGNNVRFSKCTGIHIGNVINMGHSNPENDRYAERNNGNRTKEKSKTVTGTK